jgi:tape measure domain-containing protein
MSKVVEYVLSLKDKFSGTLNNANNSVNRLEGKLKSVQKTSNETGSILGKLGASLTIAGAIAATVALSTSIVKAGADMEQTRVQFETFTGSAEKGNAVIAKLQDFSLATPFDDSQVIKAGRSLLAFGVGQDDVIDKLTKIGNISSATGKDFNELTTIYGKAKTAGTLYAEDINQLVEAGVPIIDEFAKQLNTPTSAVKKLASQGKISFGMLEKGFANLGGKAGKWGALMDKQSKTLAGRWSSLVLYRI